MYEHFEQFLYKRAIFPSRTGNFSRSSEVMDKVGDELLCEFAIGAHDVCLEIIEETNIIEVKGAYR